MKDVLLRVYTVKDGYTYDECDDSVIGTYISKDEALKVLYEKTIEYAVETGMSIEKDEFMDMKYNIGTAYYVYIDINEVVIK